MAKGYNFKIPNPHVGGKVPKKPIDWNPEAKKPTEKNQRPPTEDAPMRLHYRQAGGG